MLPIILRKKFDFFIGSNPLNALSGITLRKLGFVRKVVFYKIDYVPTRFASPILNLFYDKLDAVSSELSDWTWNLAQPMINERVKRGIHLGPQLIVPIGSNFDRIQRGHPSQVFRNRMVYMGSLRQGQGIQMAVEAFKKVRDILPNAEFVIIGSGPLEKELKRRVSKLGLDDFVTFTGEVLSHEEVEKILTTCGIGLAPYEPSPNNFTRYTEPGKVKVYLACGLPVVITRVPEIANELEARGAGFISDYTVDGLAATIVKLIQDEAAYMDARSAAIASLREHSIQF
jgi:glycosyltransferase involved in cell wall biosynthesis